MQAQGHAWLAVQHSALHSVLPADQRQHRYACFLRKEVLPGRGCFGAGMFLAYEGFHSLKSTHTKGCNCSYGLENIPGEHVTPLR